MRESKITRDEAFELLKKYNKDPFHIRHALTVEGVMRWYAKELGYADEDPEEHCKKAPELLKAGGVGDDMIYSICSHGYGICVDIEPVHEMEKVLFAADELTGLIWSAALMRPSKSVMDMEVSSLKKKFKDRRYSPCAHARAMSTASWGLTRHKMSKRLPQNNICDSLFYLRFIFSPVRVRG